MAHKPYVRSCPVNHILSYHIKKEVNYIYRSTLCYEIFVCKFGPKRSWQVSRLENTYTLYRSQALNNEWEGAIID
jgi:hypothetical protein